MNGDAVEPHGACAAIAGVATFLDPEPSHVAQKSSQALSWPRLFRESFAVDEVTHGCTLIRQVRAGSLRRNKKSCACDTPACHERRRRISEFHARGGRAARRRSGSFGNLSRCGRSVEAETVSMKTPSCGSSVPASSAVDRPEMSQRYSAKARSLAQRGSRQLDASEQIARLQHILMVAGDEILDRHAALGAVAIQNLANAFERDRQRNHRTRRQRHADIAADGGCVPDFERRQERAAALADQRRSGPIRRRGQGDELGNLASGGNLEALIADGQRLPAKPVQIDQPAQIAAAARRTATCPPPAMRRRRANRSLRPQVSDAQSPR